VIAAVSGGADSVALGLLLAALAEGRGWTVRFATLDHGLRGEAGARDRDFVERLAEREEVVCHATRVAPSPRRAGSEEMAAREARRRFLLELAESTGGIVALGHTRDDQAETVLHRLARGTGLLGAGAMRRWSPPLWRPALDVPRRALRELLSGWNQAWSEDETNNLPHAVRNRIRHEALPALERATGGDAGAGLARAAHLAAEDEELLQALALERASAIAVTRDDRSIELPRRELAAVSPPLRRRLVRGWFEELTGGTARLSSAHLLAIDALVEAESPGTAVDLPAGHRAVRRSGRLCLERPPEDPPPAG
jgi:tRNA(Ile)-lysidine synthase